MEFEGRSPIWITKHFEHEKKRLMILEDQYKQADEELKLQGQLHSVIEEKSSESNKNSPRSQISSVSGRMGYLNDEQASIAM